MKTLSTRKVFALVLSIALTISISNIGMKTFADGSDEICPITDHTTIDKNVDIKNNNFAGQEMTVAFYANNISTGERIPSGYTDAFTDGKIEAYYTLGDFGHDSEGKGCLSHGYSNDLTQTDNFWQVQISFSGYLKNPKRFVAFANPDGWGMSNHYAVFASDTADDLYSGSKKIIEITDEATANRAGDEIDLSPLGDKLSKIRYVGIRFYHRQFNDSHYCSIQFLNEIGMYGGEVVNSTGHIAYDNKDSMQNVITAAGENRFKNQKYNTKYFNNGNYCQNESDDKVKVWEEWFSGEMADLFVGPWHTTTGGCESYTAPNDILQTSSYRDIYIDLSSPVDDPEKFILSFHPEAGMASQHYAVYMSDSEEERTNEDKKVIEIFDTNTSRKGDVVDLSGKNLSGISFVTLRIYNFGFDATTSVEGEHGCKTQHISQLGLYGGTLAADVNRDGVIDDYDLVALRLRLLNIESKAEYNYDVNGDTDVNICDLVSVYNAIK